MQQINTLNFFDRAGIEAADNRIAIQEFNGLSQPVAFSMHGKHFKTKCFQGSYLSPDRIAADIKYGCQRFSGVKPAITQ